MKIFQEKRLSASVDTIWITGSDRGSGKQTTWIKQSVLKGMYVWGSNSKATKHSDYFVCTNISERVTRHCDDAVVDVQCQSRGRRFDVNPEVVDSIPAKTQKKQNRKLKSTWIWAT